MKWSEVKAKIALKLKDYDSVVDFTTVTFDGEFCKQARDQLYLFCEMGRFHYVRRVQLNTAALTAPCYEIDTLNDGVMPAASWQGVIDVSQLFINGVEVYRTSVRDEVEEITYNVTSGQPQTYHMSEDYNIAFVQPLSDTELDSSQNYVSGWMLHPAMVDDNSVVKLSYKFINTFAEFAASEFMRGAVTDDVGLARMRSYAKRAAEELAAHNARAVAGHFGV